MRYQLGANSPLSSMGSNKSDARLSAIPLFNWHDAGQTRPLARKIKTWAWFGSAHTVKVRGGGENFASHDIGLSQNKFFSKQLVVQLKHRILSEEHFLATNMSSRKKIVEQNVHPAPESAATLRGREALKRNSTRKHLATKIPAQCTYLIQRWKM